MESITVDQLKEKILDSNPVNIVDVRTDEETAMGTIPGAKRFRWIKLKIILTISIKIKHTTSYVK